MELERISNRAAWAHNLADNSLTVWAPNGNSVAIFPGSVVSLSTGVLLNLDAGEVGIVSLARDLAMNGCLLAYPWFLTVSDSGELVVTVFNKSSFVIEVKPMQPLCRIVAVPLITKAHGTKEEKVTGPVSDPQQKPEAPKSEEEGIGSRMIAAAKKLGKGK